MNEPQDDFGYAEDQASIPTPEERAADHRKLMKLHRGNRFRLMFGLPLLPPDAPPPTEPN